MKEATNKEMVSLAIDLCGIGGPMSQFDLG